MIFQQKVKTFFFSDDFHRIKVIHQDWHRHQHQPRKEKIGLRRNKTGNNEKKKNDDFYNGGESNKPDLKKLFKDKTCTAPKIGANLVET